MFGDNLFEFVSSMASEYFDLEEEDEQRFEAKVEDLYHCAEELDVPLLVMATLGNYDNDETVRLKTAVLAHIDSRRANPFMSVIAAVLEREKDEQAGRDELETPMYIKLLSAAVVMAMKEEGMKPALKLIVALEPVVHPYIEQFISSKIGKTDDEEEKPFSRDDFPEMSDAAYDSFSKLIEALNINFDDDE